MLKDKLSSSVKASKRIAYKTGYFTKAGSVKVINTTVRATKKSTNFVADLTHRIPEIGADR